MTTDTIPFPLHSPFTVALRLLAQGVKEVPGEKQNWLIASMNWLAGAGASEDPPWCGSFVGYCHRVLGFELPENPAGAREWLNVGRPKKVNEARPGDVCILWREQREGWKGHVGFFCGWDRDMVILLGGNQSDSVSISRFDAQRVLGIREPVMNWSATAEWEKVKTRSAIKTGGSEV